MSITLQSKQLSPKIETKLAISVKRNNEVAKQYITRNNPEEKKEAGNLFRSFPPVLFPYQQEFIKAIDDPKWKCLVYEKSRRIGATWSLAAWCVLEASRKNGGNCFYIGTNLNMAREFISSCDFWTSHFSLACDYMEETIIDDEKEDIQVLRIKFTSGKKIEALSSKPSSIRGRQGTVILDESAFYETSLNEYLKATLAMQIWGSKVIVLSTHNGENNEFNQLCTDIKSGKEPFYLQRTTFRQAVEQGLYKRVCLATHSEWTEENETFWVKDIYGQYGDRATEELDAIPQSSNPHAVFKPEMFQRVAKADLPSGWDCLIRFWDMAATDKKDSCYTVGVLLGLKGQKKYILDWKYCQKNPGASEDFFFDVVRADGKACIVGFELEGGSQALRYVDHVKRTLSGFTVKAIKPSGNKLLRSLPVKESAKNGEYFILDTGDEWTDEFIKTICQFDGKKIPLVTDLADALSGGHETITRKINYLLNS